jgi:hypothetical protein
MIAASYERKSGEQASVAQVADGSPTGYPWSARVIFVAGVIVVRALLAWLGRPRIRNGSVSEQWLAAHRADERPY